MIITIDGPTASGKSSVGLMLAKQLGYYYLSSGLLYRALAYLLVHYAGYCIHDLENPRMIDVHKYLAYPKHLKYTYDDQGHEHILFDGIDIAPHLKDSFMDKAASVVSKNQLVRKEIDALQRNIAQQSNIIVDGRDAGSVVFPNADFKFYITATPTERAKRWVSVQKKYGLDYSVSQALDKINERDNRDTSRKIAPLIIPVDAFIIDNTYLSQEETINKMLKPILNKQA